VEASIKALSEEVEVETGGVVGHNEGHRKTSGMEIVKLRDIDDRLNLKFSDGYYNRIEHLTRFEYLF